MAKLITEHPILSRVNTFNRLSYQIRHLVNEDNLPEDPEKALEFVLNRAPDCKSCILSETRNNVVGPDGKYGAPIMVVLEGPGFLEDLTKLPLVGQSEIKASHCNKCKNVTACFDQRISFDNKRPKGRRRAITCEPDYTEENQLPDKFNLYSSGAVIDGILFERYKGVFPRESWRENYYQETNRQYQFESPWFFTNSVQCRAWEVENLRDTPPPTLALDTCRAWLALQWACIQPRAIIAMGRPALGTLLGNRDAAKRADFDTIIESPLGPIVFTKHPAATMRERDNFRQALGHAKTAKAFDIALVIAGLIEGEELKPIVR